MTPDEVCESYSNRKINLKITSFENMIIIKGDETTLEFLSELIFAQAKEKEHFTKQLAPNGPGNIFFDEASEFGIYIEKLLSEK